MVFSSNEFIFFFLPLAVLTNYAVLFFIRARRSPAVWVANLFLLLFSLLFYAWGEPKFLVLLTGSSVLNYVGGVLVRPYGSGKSRGAAIWLGIFLTTNIALLCVFKYLNFFQQIGGVNLLDWLLPDEWKIGQFGYIALPIGISFYTFQGMSYLIDVYRRTVPPCRSFVSFSCYLTMFPQLIAGPIVRFSDIHKDLLTRKITLERVANGCSRFIFGLAKKVLMADTFGRVVDVTFSLNPSSIDSYHAWLGLVCYTLQIYYDFSAYSDMAIGIGDMLGIRFLENFNYPYFSKSIKEFWRRWHISLSTWFRDYLYFPLGGSRCSSLRTAVNLFIVFALCGLWHGADWNFLLWGLYHGLFLSVERVADDAFSFVPGFLKRMYTLFIVMMGWVLFRADGLENAMNHYRTLFGFGQPDITHLNEIRLVTYGYVLPIVLVVGISMAVPLYPAIRSWCGGMVAGVRSPKYRFACDIGYRLLLFSILLLSVGAIASGTYQSFIYFRF